MADLKPFQLATVQAALRVFQRPDGVRRFMVADEVELGKTLVAQGVMQGLMESARNEERSTRKLRPLVVFYFCSNLTIAAQNRRRLLDILPDEADRKKALCPVDRLTLMLAADAPTHPHLHLYTLTPDTSLPMRKGQRRDGRIQERALVHVLVKKLWPEYLKKTAQGKAKFQGNATSNWDWVVMLQRHKAKNEHLVQAFDQSARSEFETELKQHGDDMVAALRSLDTLDVIARLRQALASCAIQDLKPDLIIFDEFQRFLDMLLPSEATPELEQSAGRLLRALRGEEDLGEHRPPALLLLSATPYRLFTARGETGAGANHHSQFFQLVEFLYGNDANKRRDCEQAFSEYSTALRQHRGDLEGLQRTRQRVESLLLPIISRTERASHAGARLRGEGRVLKAPLHAVDLKVFKHLATSFPKDHRHYAVAYWSSIPLPLQTMSGEYVAVNQTRQHNRNHQIASTRDAPQLDEKERRRFRSLNPIPHSRLRALFKELTPPDSLALPWVAPSLPWWTLGKRWSAQGPRKALIFSRFRAVPGSVASLLSYAVESHLLENASGSRSALKYEDLTKRRALTAKSDSFMLVAQFHPSPWLANVTNPVPLLGRGRAALERGIAAQIRASLKQLGIEVKATKPSRSAPLPWQLLAQIEAKAGIWKHSDVAWRQLLGQESGEEDARSSLYQIMEGWNAASKETITSIRPHDLEVLVQYALQLPGIVFGRALRRHWPQALESDYLATTVRVSWQNLRNYLSQALFVQALCSGEDTYPQALQRAVYEGNLEAVLDEHLWIAGQLNRIAGAELATNLGDALSLRTNTHTFHALDGKKEPFTVRCHAAMPFSGTREVSPRSGTHGEGPVRTEELLKSFNSPFWPHVFITTSLGQEGLDFHTWCRTLVHWDLCSNPVDLEQREGRIQRFGGLAIRGAVAQRLGKQALASSKGDDSPWNVLQALADEQLGDASGLCPWWLYEGGHIDSFTFETPLSEQAEKLARLEAQRALYRLVLGHPYQEDFLESLIESGISEKELQVAMIELSAYFQK